MIISKASITNSGLVDYLRVDPSQFKLNQCTLYSSINYSPKLNTRIHASGNKRQSKRDDYSSVNGDRKAHCEVEVVSWRERRIKGEISVNAGIDSVWNALTDYERLADFIPNLVSR